MRQMVCAYIPEIEKGEFHGDDISYVDKHNLEDDAVDFYNNVDEVWGEVVHQICQIIGPNLYDRLHVKAKLVPDVKRFPFNLPWSAKRRSVHNEVNLNYFPSANYKLGTEAWRALVDTLTQEAVSAEEGHASLGAEEWTELCIARTNEQEFARKTRLVPGHMPFVIGQTALALINMRLFRVAQPMVGLKTKAIMLHVAEYS